MIELTNLVPDKGLLIIPISFEISGVAYAPKSISWTLTDYAGNVINSRLNVSVTPASSIEIALQGNDIDYDDSPLRIVTLTWTFDYSIFTDLTAIEEIHFEIDNFVV